MTDEAVAAPPQRPFLLMNLRSGGGKVKSFGLVEKAEQLGASVLAFEGHHSDLAALLGRAVDDGADLIGVAGGDGTLGLAAGVASERDVPLVVIPAGTRNHFALDLGLDRRRPDLALDALVDGVEVAVDLGTVADRCFVNTVSFGAYAEVVQRPDYRDNKLLVSLQELPGLLSGRGQPHFTVRSGSLVVSDPIAALVSNNPYGLGDGPGGAQRPRLDTGNLGLVCLERMPAGDPITVVREKRLHAPALITTPAEVVVDTPDDTLLLAIDGETVRLPTPVRCSLRPRALRVRLPAARGSVRRRRIRE